MVPRMHVAAATLLLILTGCSKPIFEKRYHLHPPTSHPETRCVQGCEFSRSACDALEKQKTGTCRLAQDEEPEACRARLRESGVRPRWFDCDADACVPNAAKCEETFHRCYVNCGGSVEVETRCIEHCDAAAAD